MSGSTITNTYEDEQAFRELAFKWTKVWDNKDLATLLTISAPEIVADYSGFPAVETLRKCSPEDFFKGSFDMAGLGHPDLKTQHLLGASTFTRVSATEARGFWQCRAWHTRQWSNGKFGEWDTSAYVEFTFLKGEDGKWKLGGFRPHNLLAITGEFADIVGLDEIE